MRSPRTKGIFCTQTMQLDLTWKELPNRATDAVRVHPDLARRKGRQGRNEAPSQRENEF